ncbi:MAG TPA: nuclear transport factor 2 family protein [Steroidobacteraceae bacterium]|nr:nuclear transport factor 2 family protein [Steroidobacteraceae bacterium]
MSNSMHRRPLVLLAVLGLMLAPFHGAQAAADSVPRQLARLDASLRAAEGVRAVKRLQDCYSQYQDQGMWPDLGQLFTDDVTGEFGDTKLRGRASLQRYLMRQAGRAQPGLAAGQLNTRLVLQPIVNLGADGRSAQGTWHEFSMLGRFRNSAGFEGGVYENEYVLDKGVWKISRVRFIRQYDGSYEDYGHKAPAKWNIPYHFTGPHVGVSVPAAAIDALSATARPAPAAAWYADLSRRVAALRDDTEVRNLQHAFGYYLDRKLYDDVADLFADDGSLEFAQRGAYVGHDHIRKALQYFFGPTPLARGELFDHIMLATVVTVAPDGLHAAARTTQLAQLGVVRQYARWELGVYENRFVKQDGKWKLAAVRYYPRMATDYDLGWKVDAKAPPTASALFPPDRPPARQFAMYPALQYVALSFPNPVSGRVTHPDGPVVPVDAIVAAAQRRPGGARDAAAAVAGEVTPQQLEDLRRQIAVATGVDAVENLNSSYGYYIDESDWNSMADTYSISQGAKELTGVGVYVGRERIRKALMLRGPTGGRTANFFTIHQLTQPVIHVAADGLTAKARLRLFQAGGNADGSSGSWIGGIYENTAVFENGEWKFGIQDLHHIFNASYRNGWARVGAGAGALTGKAPSPRDQRGGGITQGLGGASTSANWIRDFPPDRRIRARQYAFPEIVEPAFHYVNPVSGRKPKELLP